MEVASIGLSLAAIVISVVFAIRQERLSRKVAGIEEARRAEEVASRLEADVTARFESRPRRGTSVAEEHFLVLVNNGPARANAVDFEVPPDESMPRLMKEGMGLPVALDAGQHFEITALLFYGGAVTVPLTLRWTDGRGPQEKELHLSTL